MFRSFTIATLFLSCVFALSQQPQSQQSLLERIARLEAQIANLEKQLDAQCKALDESRAELKEMAELKMQVKVLEKQLESQAEVFKTRDSYLEKQLDELKDQVKALVSPMPAKPKIEPPVRSGNWTNVTQNANPDFKRHGHNCVVFQDKIWLLGGYDSSKQRNDVWNSTNGKEWVCITPNAPWPVRHHSHAVVFQNRLWIMGGYSCTNDVWSSPDGKDWVCITPKAGWSPRYAATCLVYQDKLWVIGGHNGAAKNDVWYSPNGEQWFCATSSAAWNARYFHGQSGGVVMDNKMWIVSGANSGSTYFSDAWYSEDGDQWTAATTTAPFAGRFGHEIVVWDNRIWLIGGYAGKHVNDVWYSHNGRHWGQPNSTTPWPARSYFACVVYDDRIWLINGHTGSYPNCNDVWKYEAK